jgi:hypothetical protein
MILGMTTFSSQTTLTALFYKFLPSVIPTQYTYIYVETYNYIIGLIIRVASKKCLR